MADETERRGASRYDAIVATFVGVCALCVSGYTAYMQRQQVRAAVWPILEYQTGNAPNIYFALANKGVGPAIVKNVIIRVDGHPMKNWTEVLDKLVGPGKHKSSENDISGHVFSPGESMTILTPHDDNDNPVSFNRTDPLWIKLNKERARVTVEICYCSSLGECWTLRGGELARGSTVESGSCPNPSEVSFQN